MNNFAVITKAEQDVAKAKAHLSVLKQKINDSKAKLEKQRKIMMIISTQYHQIILVFMNIYFRLIL